MKNIGILLAIGLIGFAGEDDTNKPPKLESVEAARTNAIPRLTPVYVLPSLEVCYTSIGPIARVPSDIDWERLKALFPTRTLTNVIFLK